MKISIKTQICVLLICTTPHISSSVEPYIRSNKTYLHNFKTCQRKNTFLHIPDIVKITLSVMWCEISDKFILLLLRPHLYVWKDVKKLILD